MFTGEMTAIIEKQTAIVPALDPEKKTTIEKLCCM
jgi:hypothetical protein